MYILYTDGKFEYSSEDSVLTYKPLQLSNNQSLAMFNGQISAVSVINGDAGSTLNMSNHYVLTIELSGIITGPCTIKLYHRGTIQTTIIKNITVNGIQPFSLTIPIYDKLLWFDIIFENNYNIYLSTITTFARVTYIES